MGHYHGSVQPQIIVRPAVPSDFDDVARITRDSYLVAGYFDSAEHPYMKSVQQVAQRAAIATIWVAERAGRIIGSVTLATAGDAFADIAREGELEFRMLVVDPAVQRSGAGQTLVSAIIKHARSIPGIHSVVLTTGEAWASARSLYAKLGFQRLPSRDWFVPGTEIKLLVYGLAVRPD